ncbi:MAG: serine protease, partial [Dolichospermum sp.]
MEAKADNNQGELTEDQIRDTAKLVTLRVFSVDRKDWEKSGLDTIYISGSGVLINRSPVKKNQSSNYIYIVLTNNHVLKSPNNQFYIQTPDGLIHQGFLHPKNSKFGNNDLGMLWFYSPYDYYTAVLGKSSTLPNNKNLTFVSGFPCQLTNSATMECPGKFEFTRGHGKNIDKPLKDGYQIAFTNPTREGMSGGPIFNTYGKFIGINGRGENEPNSEQYQYTDGSGIPKTIQRQSPALGLPIEIYLKLFPKNEQLFVGINPPKSFKIHSLNIKNITRQEQINNESYQSQSSHGNSNSQLIILIIVSVILISIGLFWFLHYEDLKELKNIKLVIKQMEDFKNIQESLKYFPEKYRDLDNINKDLQVNIKKMDKSLTLINKKLDNNRIKPLKIALLVTREDECLLLYNGRNQNDLSYSINTKTDLPEVIKIQDDAIIVSKKTVISSMIDCKIIRGTDNYQLEPITDEIIENDENY